MSSSSWARFAVAGLGLAVITMNGCFTVVRHPKSPDLDTHPPERVYPHSSVVFGWYDHHYYGSYHDYYVGPIVYYPPGQADSPSSTDSDESEETAAVLAPGFGRGGRGRDDPPRTRPVVTPPPVDSSDDTSTGNSSSTQPQNQTEPPRPKERPKAELGGRGGRR